MKKEVLAANLEKFITTSLKIRVWMRVPLGNSDDNLSWKLLTGVASRLRRWVLTNPISTVWLYTPAKVLLVLERSKRNSELVTLLAYLEIGAPFAVYCIKPSKL